MNNQHPTISLKPIGYVRNEFKRRPPGTTDWFIESESEIIIDTDLSGSLDKLEEFSHIIVLYWMHNQPSDKIQLRVRPKDREDVPYTGVFASRSPSRPNRLGLTTVRLLYCQDNLIRVKGLDALDGSPVIDIKPYISGYDSVNDVIIPWWIKIIYPWI